MNRQVKTFIYAVICLLLLIGLNACDDKDKDAKHKTRIITVKPVIQVSHLYYNGKIAPLNITNVSTPAGGTITNMFFHYGELVKDNQRLLELKSNKLEKTYQSDLTAFLKAKEKLAQSESDFKAKKEMWRLKIIAHNKYKSSRSALADSQLSLLQARYKLEQDITELGIDSNVFKLQIQDINRIRQAMFGKEFDHLILHAPKQGVALIPLKSDDSSSQGKQIQVGSIVKDGQNLVSIGDLNGLSVIIDVSEIDIDHIKAGQKATVTGIAFPDISLHGKVSEVDTQATSSNGSGGLAKFPVTIAVPDITKKEQSIIHVGMSAKVTLTIKHPPQIMIPISAVDDSTGQSTVKVYDPKSKKTKVVPVQTGQTTESSVAIISGLKAGDKVIVSD